MDRSSHIKSSRDRLCQDRSSLDRSSHDSSSRDRFIHDRSSFRLGQVRTDQVMSGPGQVKVRAGTLPHSVQLGNFKHTCYRLLPTGWVIQNLLTATSRGMKPLLICIEDAWKVSGRCLDQSFWTKVCKYVSFQTKLFSDHKENPKENSSVALLSLTCFSQKSPNFKLATSKIQGGS